MRGAVVREPGRLEIADDIPVPEIGDYDVLARILCCATCNGTDGKLVAGYLGGRYPAVLGHESVGRVERVGPKVRHLAVGDLVLRPSAVYPGEQAGPYYSAWGGFAEWGKATDLQAAREDGLAESRFNRYCRFQQKVPAMDAADAAMLVTLKETKSWLNRAGVGEGASLLVIGDGPVAAAFVGLAGAVGATQIIALGHRESRLEHLKRLGATEAVDTSDLGEASIARRISQTGAGPIDVVVDTVVRPELFPFLEGFLSPDGRLTVYGTPQPRLAPTDINEYQLTFDEAETHAEVLALVREGKLRLNDFYGPHVPLCETAAALEMVKSRSTERKVIVTMR